MSRNSHFSLARMLFLVVLASLMANALPASEPPDMEVNPVTGYVEAVDVAADAGNLVRHTVDMGQGGNGTAQTVSSSEGKNPRIAIKTNGESWVVWWQDGSTDEVFYTFRATPGGTWTPASRVSSPGQDSQYPEIVHNGSSTWIAYQILAGTTKSIAVTGITDGPEPFPTATVLATTTFSGDVDVLVHSESGHVWVTWVHSATLVGWSQWDSTAGLWSVPAFESYAGSSIQAARSNIRWTVLVE